MIRLDKTATLLPLLPQLQTCLSGSDRRTLCAITRHRAPHRTLYSITSSGLSARSFQQTDVVPNVPNGCPLNTAPRGSY
jgi:hypothetical protein